MAHNKQARHTPLTEAMVDECPAVDIHVHVPGTITPQTAWDLGIKNKLITVFKDEKGHWQFNDGPKSLGATDPVKYYSRIFCGSKDDSLTLDKRGRPVHLEYDLGCLGDGHDKFSGFDAIQATTQGHRHPPGGIQTEKDYLFVMKRYLQSCRQQNIRYTEVLQNIHLAHIIHPELPAPKARARFFLLCKKIKKNFAAHEVELRFHYCSNKSSRPSQGGTLEERALEGPAWLEEAEKIAPGVFVGLNFAGHEELEQNHGGPQALAKAYIRAQKEGFGCEAHAGEGIGVEHMMRTMRSLPITRIAHGVQVVEWDEAIKEVRKKSITLVMMPSINVALKSPLHMLGDKPHYKQTDPHAVPEKAVRNQSVKTVHIEHLATHPFFSLMREEKLPIALASDDPEQGGKSYKVQVKQLAGLDSYTFPKGSKPLSAEELALCNLHAIKAAFCDVSVKKKLIKTLKKWMDKYEIRVSHPLLEPVKTHSARQKDGRTGGFARL